jgi:hypothetical protein
LLIQNTSYTGTLVRYQRVPGATELSSVIQNSLSASREKAVLQ